jgi:single-stranded-DNA-specific exonuclease
MHPIVKAVLAKRGVKTQAEIEAFLRPSYEQDSHDPFLLPDMKKAVTRITQAIHQNQQILIYGDYDIDGMTATTLLEEALGLLGATNVTCYTPNRFTEGYGLNMDAIENIAERGADLIITVDCGSLSHAEIELAGSFGLDVIVTDHHNVADTQPPAVAVINPKRPDSQYPFRDLAGVAVVFKLIQALQKTYYTTKSPFKRSDLLNKQGWEKWFLDLVALGTICDIVPLVGENRMLAYWGLVVLRKTRRAGLRALAGVARVDLATASARDVGFALGPRMNAAGRLETAEYALQLLKSQNQEEAFGLAQKLDQLNYDRRREQDRIFIQACEQIENAPDLQKSAVLVVSGQGWSHGVVGIVASKLMEKYRRPVFVFEELDDGTAKGSARSFGDFSIAAGIDAARSLVQKGGGHAAAGGVTLATKNLAKFRVKLNKFYDTLDLKNQEKHLELMPDITLPNFHDVNTKLVKELALLEPFGMANEAPILAVQNVRVSARRTMGGENQHVKYRLKDQNGKVLEMVAFNAADKFTAAPGDERYQVLFEPTLNEWQGTVKVEGKMLGLYQI